MTVFNFSGCGLKANTWQTLGETIKNNEAIKNNRKYINVHALLVKVVKWDLKMRLPISRVLLFFMIT